jgi:hypothetical protein
MLNVFKHVPGLDKADEAPEPTEAEKKADRIKFHREQVRNGPVNFRHITNGQIRRLQERAQKRQARKEYRDKVRRQLHADRFAATLRGQLTVAGVIPTSIEYDLKRQIDATVWIVRRFGVSINRAEGGAYASFKREDVLTALSSAVDFCNRATGAHFAKPGDDFEPAIYEVEDAA